MAVTKISVWLEEETLTAARVAAEEAGPSLSAWLSQAAQRAAKLTAGLATVREYEAEAGAFTTEEIDRAGEILDELGVRPAALQYRAAVFTSDPDDLQRLAGTTNVRLRLHQV